MKVSVIISTYNGEAYVVEQLQSIYMQSRKPDEVLIFDDQSKDATLNVVTDFIVNNGLQESWKVQQNEENKGYIRNFLDGANQATGDIIFYSDQDDIWEHNKIAELEQIIVDKNADAVYCITDTIDSAGNPVNDEMNRFRRVKSKSEIEQVSIENRLRFGRSSGLCLAFKKDILEEVCRIAYKYELPHDLPVGLVAACHNKYYQVSKAMVHHRVHLNNASSPDTKIIASTGSIKKQIDSRRIKIKELNAVIEEYSELLNEDQIEMAKRALALNEQVVSYLNNRNIMGLFKILFIPNRMMNQFLTVRNILSLVRNWGKAK